MGLSQPAIRNADGSIQPLTTEEKETLKRILPDIFNVSDTEEGENDLNGVNVHAIATRAQRLADAYNRRLIKLSELSGGDRDNFEERVREEHRRGNTDLLGNGEDFPSYGNYISGFVKERAFRSTSTSTRENPNPPLEDKIKTSEPGFSEFFTSELRSGSAFVSFAVEGGSYNESFNNSVKTSSIVEKLKGANSAARDMRFATADFNIMGDIQEKVSRQLTGLLQGGADSIGLGAFAAIAGNAYIDVPKIWDDSTADLGRQSYKIRLQSQYGNKLSIILNIYLPLCMLLAAGLPRSTGKNSYSSPFLCRFFSQGKTDIKLGMIESINISRGVGNIQWTDDQLPNAIDVDFTIVNLDEIMHVPVTEGFSLNDFFSSFDEDNAFGDYLATLSAVSLYDQYYALPRLALRLNQSASVFRQWTSKAQLAQWAVSTTPGQVLSAFSSTGALPQ